MVVPPISHPKMIILCRKTRGFVGKTHHFRKPPYIRLLNRIYITVINPLIGPNLLVWEKSESLGRTGSHDRRHVSYRLSDMGPSPINE